MSDVKKVPPAEVLLLQGAEYLKAANARIAELSAWRSRAVEGMKRAEASMEGLIVDNERLEAENTKLRELLGRVIYDAARPLCYQDVLDEARAVLAGEQPPESAKELRARLGMPPLSEETQERTLAENTEPEGKP